MTTLFETTVVENILQRIENLQPNAQKQWGKMDVAQMLAHACAPLEIALGDKTYPRPFFAKLMGPLLKEKLTNDIPYGQGLPTDTHFLITEPRNFAAEKERLIKLIKRFQSSNPAEIASRKHLLLGKITGEEWGKCMHKHIDHHLRQFSA